MSIVEFKMRLNLEDDSEADDICGALEQLTEDEIGYTVVDCNYIVIEGELDKEHDELPEHLQ